MKNGIKPMCN